MRRTLAVAIGLALLAGEGCARRLKRFRTLEVRTLSIEPEATAPDEVFAGFNKLEQTLIGSFHPPEYAHGSGKEGGPGIWQKVPVPVVSFPAGKYWPRARYSSFNVSVRPAPPGPGKSAYFDSSPQAQAEIVKLFRVNAAGRTSEEALNALFANLFKSDQESKPSPLQSRVETTYSHVLNSFSDWDRHVYVASFLVLHDTDVVVEDTNQMESVLRDLEFGSLVQNSTIAAEVGGKRTDARVVGTVLPDIWELTPKVSGSLSEALTRTLREQLLQRGSSIEQDGRVFRLTQRGGALMALPAMLRQILTLRYTSSPTSVVRVNLLPDRSVAVEPGIVPTFQRACRASSAVPDPDFNIEATPLFFSVIRRISNEKGVRTYAFDDDDRAEYIVEVDRRRPVTLRTEQIGWETIVASTGSGKKLTLHVRLAPGGNPATAVLSNPEVSGQFAALLSERLSTMNTKDRESGRWLRGYRNDAKYDLLEFSFEPRSAVNGNPVAIPPDLDLASIRAVQEILGRPTCPASEPPAGVKPRE